MQLDPDAFASGQILSKLWLAETLEKTVEYQNIDGPLKILVLGGWYGTLNLIFRIRRKLKIEHLVSMDIDNNACDIAETINNTWNWLGEFKTLNSDANRYCYSEKDFDIVINTSVEHIDSKQWFDNVPKGVIVALQSNDMTHDDHSNNHSSLEDFISDFPLSELYFDGAKLFSYPDKEFKRYMIIGKK